jgi:uncharacterized membrane protein YbhN (UPF0104 family)
MDDTFNRGTLRTNTEVHVLSRLKNHWGSLPKKLRFFISTSIKLGVTALAFYALLTHKIDVGEGDPKTIIAAIAAYLPQVDATTFWTFCAIAGAIKLVGVGFSAWSWHLLLVGQGIRFPFWRHVVTTFLIGRFIGTFLPSTIGLDGYTLYDAGKYSQEWERATTAKVLEKFIGVTGLFLGMLVLLPFGVHIFGENAMLAGSIVVVVAGGVVATVFLAVFRPGIIQFFLRIPFPGRAKVESRLTKVIDAAGAYRDKPRLLCVTFAAKFMVHFTTAVVYVFTAIAVGVVDIDFGAITFASTIQILATVLSPTIAGEGAREAVQAMLLSGQMTTVQAVLSASLGFIAAEAATLWGGAFWWARRGDFRPAFTLVDGKQVDYDKVDGVTNPAAPALRVGAASA